MVGCVSVSAVMGVGMSLRLCLVINFFDCFSV